MATVTCWGRAQDLQGQLSEPASGWRDPLLGWVVVATFNLATALSRGVSTTVEAATNWWITPDAVIPELTARWFINGHQGEILPGWHASDRGPLQALLLLWAGEWSTHPVPAYVVGVIVNSTWVIGLWWLLRTLDIAEPRIRAVVMLAALTGAIWLNTVYPWPKLLSGALMLGATAALLRRRPLLAGALIGLALLAHGSALFAIVALIPWLVTRLGRGIVVVAAVAALLYLPWTVFGRVVDPPGDRLVKWHLAGTDIGTPDPRPAPVSIVDSYRRAGPKAVGYKVNNLRFLVGDPTVGDIGGTTTHAAQPAWEGRRGQVRAYQVNRLSYAPGVLLLGLFWSVRKVPRTLWMMLGAGALTYVLLEWGGDWAALTWLHTAPMSMVLIWVVACGLGAPKWLWGLQVATFVGLWLLAPVAAIPVS